MAKKRTSVVMMLQIKELKSRGLSHRKIADALGICRKTVTKVLEAEQACEVESLPQVSWALAIDWSRVHAEVLKGVPVKILFEEYAPPVSYRKFWGEYRKKNPLEPDITIKLHHVPGEWTQVDFCDGLSIYDQATGHLKGVSQFFAGVLPFSSYTFGVFVMDQKRETFIECHERMWEYFGGVTKYVRPDNLRSAVSRAHRYDPEVNPVFVEYANHLGFAVVPARVRKPRDKGCVESVMRVVQRSFFQQVRDKKFYSLAQLNESFSNYLNVLNRQKMSDYGVSRADRFIEEKKHLLVIPLQKWEMSDWREAKIHPDCHVQVDRCFYSAPFAYVG